MRFSRLATLLALAAGLAFVGIPQAGFLYDQLARQEQEIFRLHSQLDHLSGGQDSLGRDQRALQELQADLRSQTEQLAEHSELLQRAQDQLTAALQQSRGLLDDSMSEVQDLRRGLRAQEATLAEFAPKRRLDALRHDVLGPVFQLSGRDAVGSAVLIHRGSDAAGSFHLALTCFHVVRDILEERDQIGDLGQERIDAIFLDTNGNEHHGEAYMIAWEESRDLALLRMDGDQELGPLARLASPQKAAAVGVFEKIYTVGCPLGTATQATSGEVTRKQWFVDGNEFWMVSSPAYFGNSGGGVFLNQSHELIGLFAKIYTHGSYRPQVITHMGLAIPIDVVYHWLESCGHGDLIPTPATITTPTETSTQVRVEDATAQH